MIYNGCVELEQTNYNWLKANWSRLPSGARGYCDEVARVTGGSYQILKGCIDLESGALENPQSFHF